MGTSQFIFDTTLQDYVPNPAYDNDTPKVGPYLTVSDVTESTGDNITEIPGGSGPEFLQPPDTFNVTEQIVRNNPDGSTTIDIIIDVEDGVSVGRQYEVRVTR